MDAIYEPPWRFIIGGVCLVVFLWGEWRGTRLVLRGLREPGHKDQNFRLIRGVRAWIVGWAAFAFGAGAFFRAEWAVLFGLVFLGEELLETGTYLLVLRSARRRDAEA